MSRSLQDSPPTENAPAPEGRLWALAALLLWLPFFSIGLFPDYCYYTLRSLADVVTSRALVNSVGLLYFLLVGYFYGFLYRSARGAGVSVAASQVIAVQLSIVAMIAFFPIPLEDISDFQRIGVPWMRRLTLTICAFKIASWLYLLSLVFRYYLWSGPEVFRQMVPVFPSGRPDHDE